MASSRKIEDRTKRFITEYERLSNAKDFPTHEELATIIGAKSKGTITEILKQRQNIQPDQWEKFKLHFGIGTNNSVQNKDNTEILGLGDKYMHLLESNDRFFKNEYAQMLLSLKELIGLSKKQEALLKLNLQHVGAVEALQRGVEPEVIQEQINIQIADMGPSEEMDNDVDSQDKP